MKEITVLLLIGVITLVTNPKSSDHEETIIQAFKKENALLSLVGVGTLYAKLTTYENFTFFSITKQNENIVSIGIANKVFMLRNLDFDI